MRLFAKGALVIVCQGCEVVNSILVYLRSPPEVCEKRIRIRQRKGEDSMSIVGYEKICAFLLIALSLSQAICLPYF